LTMLMLVGRVIVQVRILLTWSFSSFPNLRNELFDTVEEDSTEKSKSCKNSSSSNNTYNESNMGIRRSSSSTKSISGIRVVRNSGGIGRSIKSILMGIENKIGNINVDTLSSDSIPTTRCKVVLNTIETIVISRISRTIANWNR